MFEIKVSIEVPALVEAAKILAMRQIPQAEVAPEKVIEAVKAAPVVAMPAPAPAGPSRAAVATAGAQLLSQQPAMQAQLVALLGKYGAQTVQDIPEAQLGAFAGDLRAMGAQI